MTKKQVSYILKTQSYTTNLLHDLLKTTVTTTKYKFVSSHRYQEGLNMKGD